MLKGMVQGGSDGGQNPILVYKMFQPRLVHHVKYVITIACLFFSVGGNSLLSRLLRSVVVFCCSR